MGRSVLEVGDRVVVEHRHIQDLIDTLREKGYRTIGPTIRDGAIIYDEIDSIEDLPVGWTDVQDGGKYRLIKRNDEAFFGYVLGPHSWKRFLYPPRERLWKVKKDKKKGFNILQEEKDIPKFAFLGVRPCELHAIRIQDKIFMDGEYKESRYTRRREGLFLITLNCGQAGGTCFCVSMTTGPRATSGFDLLFTEIIDAKRSYFVVETGTEHGIEVIKGVPHHVASDDEIVTADEVIKKTATQMGRALDTTDIKALLYESYEHPRWDEVAVRCLTCGNCTMVCPTCFCTTVEDITDLTGESAERWRRWDSCFTMEFSYIHGGSVRLSHKSRYRQWLIHKLAAWIDQFGESGCVGCGRCITWCPVGIDITEEVRAIRESKKGKENKDGDP